jgi:hypothetical protein
LQSSGGKEKRYAFKTFKINQTTLNKLFRGDFKKLEDMIDFYSKNQSDSQLYHVFYYKKHDEDDKTTKVIIDCIFIN